MDALYADVWNCLACLCCIVFCVCLQAWYSWCFPGSHGGRGRSGFDQSVEILENCERVEVRKTVITDVVYEIKEKRIIISFRVILGIIFQR